jgi:hypothetical protein
MPNLVEIILRAKNEASKELKDVDSKLGNLSKTALKTGGVMMAAGGAFVGAALGMVRATANLGDELNALSQRTGIAVETLSEYKHVADISETSLDGLARALKFLATNMYAAERGGAEQIKAFHALNVNWRDGTGQLKSLDSMLEDVADSISKETDETKQAAMAVQLFGRGGLEILPVLKLGSAGIRALRLEAHELEIVMTTEQAQAGDQFNDNMTRIKESVKGVAITVGNSLIPKLIEGQGKIIEVAKVVIDWAKAHETLVPILFKTALVITGAGGILVGIGLILKIAPLVGVAFTSWLGPIGLAAAAIAYIATQMWLIPKAEEAARAAMIQTAATLPAISERVKELAEKGYPGLRAQLDAVALRQQWFNESVSKGPAIHAQYAEMLIKERQALADLVLQIEQDIAVRQSGMPVSEEELKLLKERKVLIESFKRTGPELVPKMRTKAEKPELPAPEMAEEVPLISSDVLTQAIAGLEEVQATTYSVHDAIVGAAAGMTNAFANFFTSVLTGAMTFASAIKSLFASLVSAIISELARLAAIKIVTFLTAGPLAFLLSSGGKVPGISTLTGSGYAASGGKIAGYYPLVSLPAIAAQSGGKLYGGIAGRDSVPIMGMPGEVILPTRLVTQLEAVFGRNAGSSAQAGGRVQQGGEVHIHYFEGATVMDAISIRRMIRSGELGEEINLGRKRGDIR